MAGLEMSRGGVLHVQEQPDTLIEIATTTLEGPDFTMTIGSVSITEGLGVDEDLVAPPVYLLRPREDVAAFAQTAGELGIDMHVKPIYTHEGAEQATARAIDYTDWLERIHGVMTDPTTLDPAHIYRRGAAVVGIVATAPGQPDQGLSNELHDQWATRTSQLLSERDARAQGIS